MTIGQDLLSNHFVQILIVILSAILMQIVSKYVIEHLVRKLVLSDRFETKLDRKKRQDTVIGIFKRVFIAAIWIVVVIFILTILNVNIAALLTGAGLFGVIVGLGAQNTIKDYLAGIYILTENQYRVGDIVTLSGGTTTQLGTSGMVEEITLRITKLRDLDGTVNIVRNGEAGIITNRTSKYSSVVLNIYVDYDDDLKKVEEVINKVGHDMLDNELFKKRIIEPIIFFRVEDFTEFGVRVQCLGKVLPAEQWDVASVFRRNLKVAFDEAGLHFGVPHREVRTTSK